MSPLRVLHLISSPAAGGAEVYVKDLVISIRRKGHFAAICFVSRAADLSRSQEFETKYLAELDAEGIPYFFLGHDARKNPIAGAFRVWRLCRENGITVYHSHLKYGIAYGAMLRIPKVHTHHTIVPKAGRFMYFLFNRFVDAYVGISRVCAEKLREFTGRDVTTICNGVNREKLAPFISGPRSGQTPLACLAVGQIQPPKNYDLMIEALALIPESLRPALHVSIAGEGPRENMDALKDQIVRKDLSGMVTLLGNRSDIPKLMGESQLFLMSSAWEGLPIALIEATLSGLPCIVTDVGGCSEVVDACESGIVVPNGNARLYADAVQRMLCEEGLINKFSQNALDKSNIYSINSAAEGHVALYARLCGDN